MTPPAAAAASGGAGGPPPPAGCAARSAPRIGPCAPPGADAPDTAHCARRRRPDRRARRRARGSRGKPSVRPPDPRARVDRDRRVRVDRDRHIAAGPAEAERRHRPCARARGDAATHEHGAQHRKLRTRGRHAHRGAGQAVGDGLRAERLAALPFGERTRGHRQGDGGVEQRRARSGASPRSERRGSGGRIAGERIRHEGRIGSERIELGECIQRNLRGILERAVGRSRSILVRELARNVVERSIERGAAERSRKLERSRGRSRTVWRDLGERRRRMSR